MNELTTILLTGTNEERLRALENVHEQDLSDDIFAILIGLLESGDNHTVFIALFTLIKHFPRSLESSGAEHVDLIYGLLFVGNGPVTDRAMWALSIMGDPALNKLLEEYSKGSNSVKAKVVMTVGRGSASHRPKERLNLLLDGLQSIDDDLQFVSLCEIMPHTPVSPWESERYSLYDNEIDWERVYAMILPVARKFSVSQQADRSEFATRYLAWLETRNSH